MKTSNTVGIECFSIKYIDLYLCTKVYYSLELGLGS